MSLHQFFLENQVLANETEETFPLMLSADDEKHARVLRLREGEHIAVVDASSDYFEVEIVDASPRQPLVKISQHMEAKPNERPAVVLVQGLAKGDKMDDIIRHSTELGIAGIMPMKSARSIVRLDEKKTASRIDRWRQIAKSAAMQSGRLSLPFVDEPRTVKQLIQALAEYESVLVCWEETDASATLGQAMERIRERINGGSRIAVVIGPEGGLSPEEVDALCAALPQAQCVTLGPTILRTETAGIVAPALVIYELGGLGKDFKER